MRAGSCTTTLLSVLVEAGGATKLDSQVVSLEELMDVRVLVPCVKPLKILSSAASEWERQ